MGLFNRLHDFLGVNANKLKGSLRETSQKMRDTKKRLQKSERCRKMRIKPARF